MSPGTRIGGYEVLAKLGEGGMGEVYRARDTKLGRDVAIKILPHRFTADRERLARFDREARVLASLNHPNIATVHGVEDADGTRALIMELIEGDTLAERIRRGPLSPKDAVAIARQLTEALDAAHERGIIHRDLKPANIKITGDGLVKVLDFGLAKALAGGEAGLDQSEEPTVTAGMTRDGLILGTAAYMSPEQARGKAVDKRTDIWAFGCVLYEMLAGRPAFAGETYSDTIAAVLERDPPWSVLPETTPPVIRRLLQRCLEKDPRQRLRDIGDARSEIAAGSATPPATVEARTGTARRERLAWAMAGLGAIATAGLAMTSWERQGRSDEEVTMVRSVIALPPAHSLELDSGSLFAVSPDGTRLVYSASREGRSGLYVRTLDQFQSSAIEGTAGGTHPFFSPDGHWVGFFANGALKKAPVDGGTPTVICDTPVGHGASWAPDNTIVFARPGGGLMRVSADGGTPQPATSLNASRGETGHDWPQILPGGQSMLFTIVIGSDNGAGIAIAPLDGGETRVVAAGPDLDVDSTASLLPPGDLVQARYLRSGHLVFGQVGAVWGLPFDLAQLTARGSPIQLLDNVFEGPGGGAIYFAVTERGSLLYVPAGRERSLVRVDRRGRTSPIGSTRGAFRLLRLSADGRRLAVCIDVPAGPTSIWAFDMERGTPARMTSLGHSLVPVWSPDGARVAYTLLGELYTQPADGTGKGELLLSRPGNQEPYSWTPDGTTLLFSERSPGSNWDLWAVSLREREARPALATSDNERLPVVSANGRWLAYISDESGRYEVYVRPFRGPGARVQVSLEGGTEPVWSRDGKELFFRRQNEYYAAAVKTAGSFQADSPQFLFAHGLPFVSSEIASYDVTPDGRHFVMIDSDPDSAPTHFRLVTNWLQDLSSRLPSSGAR